MAEPYVPIASLAVEQALMTTVELSTTPASADTSALVAATASALASRNSAQALSSLPSLLFAGA